MLPITTKRCEVELHFSNSIVFAFYLFSFQIKLDAEYAISEVVHSGLFGILFPTKILPPAGPLKVKRKKLKA